MATFLTIILVALAVVVFPFIIAFVIGVVLLAHNLNHWFSDSDILKTL